ncbi:hypothetical protein [Acidovorax sp.]|uniref:hypothetical protein n=1 Tax=Acidovorax sp. TaxID=1872122 RepID=UPI0027B8A7DC|nr:hypothetical protein [Acidovorax sp.]
MTIPKVTQSHRWKNSMADIYAWRNRAVVQDFLQDVVQPSFVALQARIDRLQVEAETDQSVGFLISDVEELRIETSQAFCLAVQSIWERQLRTYVAGCADVLEEQQRPDHVAQARHVKWSNVEEAFFRVRGIRLNQMPGYPELSLLHVLGNACRHGPGPSMDRLRENHPELWPGSSPGNVYGGIGPVVPVDLLERFCEAIQAFWDEAEYIYCESITAKHSTLERRLQQERAERAGAKDV